MEIEVEIVTDDHGVIHAKCVACRESTPLEITPEEFKRFIGTATPISVAFPNMEREYRDMLVSGFCPRCWHNLFKPRISK